MVSFFLLPKFQRILIKRKIGSWCRVYLQDMAPISLYYMKDGAAVIYLHDAEDYLKFRC